MIYTVILGDHTYEIEIDQDGRVKVDGQPSQVDIQNLNGGTLFSLLVDHRSYEILVESEADDYHVLLGGKRYDVVVQDERTRHLAKVGQPTKGLVEEVAIKAPMPGLVVAVPVSEGQAVKAGQGIVILAAMKMENELRAPADGVVRAIRVAPGDAVDQGQALVVIGGDKGG
jgi:pyruvate carboxylase subunit B